MSAVDTAAAGESWVGGGGAGLLPCDLTAAAAVLDIIGCISTMGGV